MDGDTALLVGMCWALLILALAMPVTPSRIVSLCLLGYQQEPGRGGIVQNGAVRPLVQLSARCPDFRYAVSNAAHEGHDFGDRAGFTWPLEKPVTECAAGARDWVLENGIHHNQSEA